ncbi:MAG: beta-N-acetylhexosaminidase [Armatimonadota bacterium]|nr:beta-N-acetylhexosaminidase [Armatimonadota bacterium]
MRTVTPLIALIVSMLAGLAACAEQQMKPDSLRLVPWPHRIIMSAGNTVLPAALPVKTGGDDPEAAGRVAKTLAGDLIELGFTPSSAKKGPKIVLSISPDKALGPEGYRLRVTSDIRISAATEKGLFWGTRTALQLAAKGPGATVPRLTIFDKPEYWYRGLLIDAARQFHSIDFHRQTIKRLAQYKVAFYQVHFTDDQSWTLPSEKFPALPTPGRHYAKDELKDLVKLAAQYHVTIVPEIEMPGHSSVLCAAVPDVVCGGKPPRWMTCGGSEKSFAALTALITEAMDIFPGPYFHIGADECDYALWDGCPDCTAAKAKEGLKDNEALYNRFVNHINSFIKSKGRKTIIWEGFKVGKEPLIDKDILVHEWNNKEALPGDLMGAGYDIVNCSSGSLYVVVHWATQAPTPEIMAEWNALYFGGGYPVKKLDQMTKVSPNPKLKGVGMCSWENEERAEDSILFGIGNKVEDYADPAPRVQIMAERAWTGASTSVEDLLKRVGVAK